MLCSIDSAHPVTIDLTLSDGDEERSANGSDTPARRALQLFNPRKGNKQSPRGVLQQFQPRKLPPAPKSLQHVEVQSNQRTSASSPRPSGGRAIRSTTQDPRRRFDAIASRHSRTDTPRGDVTTIPSPNNVEPPGTTCWDELDTHAVTTHVRDTPAHPASFASISTSEPKDRIISWDSKKHSRPLRDDRARQTEILTRNGTSASKKDSELDQRTPTFSPMQIDKINSLSASSSFSRRSSAETDTATMSPVDATVPLLRPFSSYVSTDMSDDLEMRSSSSERAVATKFPHRLQARPIDTVEALPSTSAVPGKLKRTRDGLYKNRTPPTVNLLRPMDTVQRSDSDISDAESVDGATSIATAPPNAALTDTMMRDSPHTVNDREPISASMPISIHIDMEEEKVIDLARQSGNQRTILFVREMFSSLRENPHEGKIRVSAWTLAEDKLILHIRKELGGAISWKNTGDFFPHRKSWHPLQSRYSTILQHYTVDSLVEKVLNGGNVGLLDEKRTTLLRQSRLGQPSAASDDREPHRLPRPKRAGRTDHPGLYSERRALSSSPAPGLLSSLDRSSHETTAGPQTRQQLGRPSVLDISRTDSSETAPVSRRGLQSSPLPPSWKLNEERRRNLAALAGNMIRISGPKSSHLVERPYLPKYARTYGAGETSHWDNTTASVWAGTTVHADFDEEELRVIEETTSSVRKLAVTDPSMSLPKRLHTLLTGIPKEQIRQIASRVVWEGTCLGRSEGAIAEFICDARESSPESDVGTTEVVSFGLSPSSNNRGRMIRGREMGQSQLKTSLAEFDTLGPALHFKGTSGDVNQVAWAPDGDRFAVASFAVTDENSLAYNKPNNLLFGRLSDKLLLELPQHFTRNNAYGSASTVHDSLIFQTVSGLEFSPDGSCLVTAGYDRQVRVWDMRGVRPVELASIGHEQRIDVVSISPRRVFATGSQGHNSPDDERTAGPSVRVFRINEDDPAMRDNFCINTYSLSNRAKLLDPACLRFGCAQEGRYLLGAFSSTVPTYNKGILAIWDVINPGSSPLIQISSGNVFDAVWSPHAFGRIAVGSARIDGAASGTQSVVRIYDSSRWSSMLNLDKGYTLELECPAKDMNDVVFGPGDPFLVSTGCTDGRAYVWDIRNPKRLLHIFAHGRTLSEKDDNESADTGVRFLSWGQSGRDMYSGSSDGIVMQWDPYRSAEDAYIRDVVRLESGVMSGAFSPDFTNLLLGDVAGSVSLLCVGNDDRGMDMCEADPFEYEEAVAFKRHMRRESEGKYGARTSAKALIKSGKVEFRPFGNLPKLQAVQGPNYVEPTAYNSPSGYQPRDPILRQLYYQNTVPDLRAAAATFQARARAHEAIEPCKCMMETKWVTEEDFGDSGAWKHRIPAELRQAQAARLEQSDEAANLSDRLDLLQLPVRCFQCNQHELTLMHRPIPDGAVEDGDDLYKCPGCRARWRVDILGFTPIQERYFAGVGSPSEAKTFDKRTGDDLQQNNSTFAEDNMGEVGEPNMDYYHTLWNS